MEFINRIYDKNDFVMNSMDLVGNVLFWNVFKTLEKKDMRYVLKTFWNVAETCREIEDISLHLLYI